MNLKDLDLSQLSEQEQMQLYPFWYAYHRPSPPAMTWRDCVKEGLEKKEYTKCGIVEITESLDELDTLSSFHLNDDGEVVPGEVERCSWQDRLINKWTRREVWSIH